MPRGDKSKYTNKEKRQAEHIEEGYEKRGVREGEAERRAWATVNKVHGGGEKPGGGGYGKPENHEAMRKGGRRSHGSEATGAFQSQTKSHKRQRASNGCPFCNAVSACASFAP